MEINILIEESLGTEPDAGWLYQIVEKVLTAENLPPNVEISLLVTDQKGIQDLNREYRGKDQPTDVLSFAMSEEKEGVAPEAFIGPPDGLLHLGEVIISYPQALIQAQESSHSVRKELAILTVHGILHILGYDHEKPEMEPAMKAREKEILSEIKEEFE